MWEPLIALIFVMVCDLGMGVMEVWVVRARPLPPFPLTLLGVFAQRRCFVDGFAGTAGFSIGAGVSRFRRRFRVFSDDPARRRACASEAGR